MVYDPKVSIDYNESQMVLKIVMLYKKMSAWKVFMRFYFFAHIHEFTPRDFEMIILFVDR